MNEFMSDGIRRLGVLFNRQLRTLPESLDISAHIVIATGDGLPLAWVGGDYERARRQSALASAFSGLVQTMVRETVGGSHEGVVIESQNGVVVVRSLDAAARDLVLFIVFEQGVNQGQALWFARRLGESLVESVSGAAG
ncbi:roadblock/LC7 domain-containing protein [Derxia gummosa]|uniref:Roadblock/LC7 domain-containing protein n=1 Tax=Derxia gummosa DSM 723 TaxID=1121388 RepID=A0A8B6X7W8_9BURK|nr:roadblock/LC7 domain-containing protein [Derxia gummosa]